MSTQPIPAAPPRPPGHRARYSTAVVKLARTMYGDGDSWTPTQIKRYLNEQGHPVCLKTVRTWVVPGVAEDYQRHNNLYYQRRKRRAGAPALTPLQRMRQLRDAGLTFSGIAVILRVDWGV